MATTPKVITVEGSVRDESEGVLNRCIDITGTTLWVVPRRVYPDPVIAGRRVYLDMRWKVTMGGSESEHSPTGR